MQKQYAVYIMTNRRHTVLYTGMTNALFNRGWQHKQKMAKGFTQKYNVDKLVYFEEYENVWDAIEREKQIKGWTRKKKEALINTLNPEWRDLYNELSPF